jgi:hypothetical protein
MFASIFARPERWLLAAVTCGVLAWFGFASRPGAAAPSAAKTVWQYREVEVQPSAIQAALDDLGRDGWEVFNVYGASAISTEGSNAKLVPHTFYVFAKRPL